MSRIKSIALDSRGLTVVEVMVSAFIVSTALVAFAWVMPISTSNIQQSNLKSNSVFLLQQRLEQVRNAQWTATPSTDNLSGSGSDGTAPVATWPDDNYNTIAGYPSFRRTVRITDCGLLTNPCGLPSASSNTRRAVVSVYFRPMAGGGGANPNAEDGVQVTTLIAKR